MRIHFRTSKQTNKNQQINIWHILQCYSLSFPEEKSVACVCVLVCIYVSLLLLLLLSLLLLLFMTEGYNKDISGHYVLSIYILYAETSFVDSETVYVLVPIDWSLLDRHAVSRVPCHCHSYSSAASCLTVWTWDVHSKSDGYTQTNRVARNNSGCSTWHGVRRARYETTFHELRYSLLTVGVKKWKKTVKAHVDVSVLLAWGQFSLYFLSLSLSLSLSFAVAHRHHPIYTTYINSWYNWYQKVILLWIDNLKACLDLI